MDNRISALYDALGQLTPSPVIEINRAVAHAQAFGPAAGLEILEAIRRHPALASYHLLHAVRGDLLARLGRMDQARRELARAAKLLPDQLDQLLAKLRRVRLLWASASDFRRITMVDETTDGGVPEIYEVYPHLHVRDGAAAIDFYRRVFGAQELMRLAYPDGRIAHAELKLGSVTVLLADEHPEYGVRSPLAFGGTGSSIHLHVDDVDRLARRAIEAGPPC